jgi:hypothetical protein
MIYHLCTQCYLNTFDGFKKNKSHFTVNVITLYRKS